MSLWYDTSRYCGNYLCDIGHPVHVDAWSIEYEETLGGFLRDGILFRCLGWAFTSAVSLENLEESIHTPAFLVEQRLVDPPPGFPALYSLVESHQLQPCMFRPPLSREYSLRFQEQYHQKTWQDVEGLSAIAWTETKPLTDPHHRFSGAWTQWGIERMAIRIDWTDGSSSWERGTMIPRMLDDNRIHRLVEPRIIALAKEAIQCWEEMQRAGAVWATNVDTHNLTKRFGPAQPGEPPQTMASIGHGHKEVAPPCSPLESKLQRRRRLRQLEYT